MGIENPVHLLFIAAIALVFLGPKRLPELAKALGHGLREFREAISTEAQGPGAPAQQPAPQPPVGPVVAAEAASPAAPAVAAEPLVSGPAQAVGEQPPDQA